jgi:serine/threonine protein kinase/tetratricopeptide (TPR) repeat protein
MAAAAIGPYQLLEPLGEGGMGVVYRAKHMTSGRAVALKTVGMLAPTSLEGIRREIVALTRIRHPAVVRILDHGVFEGRPWYAMDLLEGESLAHYAERIWSASRAPLSPAITATSPAVPDAHPERADRVRQTKVREPNGAPLTSHMKPTAAAGHLEPVLRIVRRICATVAFLHGEGFVNCDLKPSNVLVVNGQPIIIDFGLTAHHPGGTGREELGAHGAMAGTLHYMPPEQIRGELLDARSDLYSLGCMLYELVTGTVPFTGAPISVRSGHLSAPPVAPSELVEGVTPELERLIVRLLEKDPAARFGYADEVASLLAHMSGDTSHLSQFPPARPYLYRPRLVGRDDLVERLVAMRDRACGGSGGLAILGGESGSGKTRVAMEVARLAMAARMRVIASDGASAGATSFGTGPLHAVRPLLRAAVDRCLEGGADVTERLIGSRRSVLALYEPLLAQIPAAEPLPAVIPLSAESSRQRLFSFLRDVVRGLCQEHPTLWIIDDVGWADELSLAFLGSLSSDFFEGTPVLLLCTYRTEEITESVSLLAGLAHSTHIVLPRLCGEAVQSMIADMLASTETSKALGSYVAEQAEGNPFFVTEYLRAAIGERLLLREDGRTWKISGSASQAVSTPEAIALPGSVRELIERRLAKLSPPAQQTAQAAAVLGREQDTSLLRRLAAISEEGAAAVIGELLRTQVLEVIKGGALRFVHDKLREVLYARTSDASRTWLHGRAGDLLAAEISSGAPDGGRWGIIGRHYANARQSEPAIRYLKLAADHARATHANRDAIRLYADAVKEANQLVLSLSGDLELWEHALLELCESLGDVHRLVGSTEKARAAYEECLARSHLMTAVARARVTRKIGKTWESEHRHDRAIEHYEAAQAQLPQDAAHASANERDEWFQVRIDRIWVSYWLDDVEEMDRITSGLLLLLEQHGSAVQRLQVYRGLFLRDLRKHRFAVDDRTLEYARTALAACDGLESASERPFARFHVGFALLLMGRVDEAITELTAAHDLAVHVGDSAVQARSLMYLSLAARIRGDASRALELTDRFEAVAVENGMLEYLAAAHAQRAWARVCARDFTAARALARQALEIWRQRVFPFQWLALVPLLAASIVLEDDEDALASARGLLEPQQQRLPDAAATLLGHAVAQWDAGHRDGAVKALRMALEALEGNGAGGLQSTAIATSSLVA